MAEAAYRLLGRVIDVRREELPALLWCWLYIFAVLSSYYIMRPIRAELGLLLGAAVLLEVAVFAAGRLSRLSPSLQRRPGGANEERPIGGSVLAGITHALSSPYLLNVSLFLLLFAITSTILYFQQADIV